MIYTLKLSLFGSVDQHKVENEDPDEDLENEETKEDNVNSVLRMKLEDVSISL